MSDDDWMFERYHKLFVKLELQYLKGYMTEREYAEEIYLLKREFGVA